MRRKDKRYANRGMQLERMLDKTNEAYQKRGQGIIKKLPTPVHIYGVNKGIVRGALTKGELVDYIGMSEGIAVAYDAKQTKGKSLPLSNIAVHQYRFLKDWHYNGGAAFLVIRFSDLMKNYVYPFERIQYWYEGQDERKSIPLADVEEYGEEIDKSTGILDYMKTVRKWSAT